MRNKVNIAPYVTYHYGCGLYESWQAFHLSTAPQHWSAANLYWPGHNNSSAVQSTLWGQTETEKGLSVSKETPVQYRKQQKDCLPPARACCPRAERGEEEGDRDRRTEIKKVGDSMDSKSPSRFSRDLEKFLPLSMTIEPKWRRTECGVATDNDKHV